MLKKLLASAAICLGLVGLADGQTYPPPQVQSIGPNDLFQDIVGGVASAGNQYASGALLSGTFGGAAQNFLVGGDPSTNLFQRSVAGAAITGGTGATVVYTADRWANWEAVAGSTANSTIKATTAATLGPGATASMLFKLTNSQTGTAQICTAQVITNQNSAYLAGHTVELDFNAYAGATWTASQVNAYIIYGTDATDTGVNDLAFGLNANSVSSTTWAGQTNATVGAFPMSVSTMYREMAVATLPATATEVAAAFCWTPNGTSSGTGGTDGVYLSNIELRKADYLVNWANATTAYSVNTTTNVASATINGISQTVVVPAFSRSTPVTEALLQYSYFYVIAEADTAGVVQGPAGNYDTTTTCSIAFLLPAPMRIVPTLVTTVGGYNALSATTFKIDPTTTPVVLATAFAALQTGASTTTSGVVSFKTTTETQYIMCTLNSTASGGGAFAFNAEE
jgi:hypothetical protein